MVVGETLAMFSRCGFIVVLVSVLTNVEGQDPRAAQHNLLQVFRDVPTLFQRIVDMLHERPEILEKDDITTFLETAKDKLSQLMPEENSLKVKREILGYDLADGISIDGAGQDLRNVWYLRKADDDFDGFLSAMVPGASQLTSDEVAEMMIMVERKLEEYYNDTK